MQITLENLSFSYHDKPLFSKIDAVLSPGKLHYLAGPNGSGKSTLLKLLAGFLKPDSGQVMLDQKPIFDLAGHYRSRHMGILFQSINMSMDFTVREMIYITASARFPRLGAISSEARQRLSEVCNFFGLDELSDKPVNTLSGGEQQRTLLAGLAALAPDVMLLDEPTSALDPAHRNQVMDFLEAYACSHTVLIITHDLELLSRAQGALWLLDQQSNFHCGDAEDLLNEELLGQIYNTPCTVETRPNGRKRICFD